MFKRLLSLLSGNKEARVVHPSSVPTTPTPETEEQFITAYDTHGHEQKITRSESREKVLPPNLQQKWNEPDELYNLIVFGLDDGFAADLLPAANRLLEIDPIPERSHTIHCVVLMKNGQLDAAEATLREGMRKAGEMGIMLTNLAKVYAERGDEARSHEILWQAIQADPNQDNGLGWWTAIHRDSGGEAGYLQALRTVAALSGSWRAQLWLARHYLEHGEVEQARTLYENVLAGSQYDGSALTMISGDLGNNGQSPLIAQLIGPTYREMQHDPKVGLNLLRAYQKLGQVDAGEALLSRMYALDHAPSKEHLDRFAQAFQEMRTSS